MKKFIWLYLSSFGIMFAILSGIQEGGLLPDHMGWGKGFFACVLGAVLYATISKTLNLHTKPQQKKKLKEYQEIYRQNRSEEQKKKLKHY